MQRPIEILTPAEMGHADRLAAASGTPGPVLMDRAGRAVADAAERMLAARGGRRALVLCGPGNNGGDGFVAAAELRRRGFAVDVAALAPLEHLRGDAAGAAAAWAGPVGDAAGADPVAHDLVVDALFGAGLSRPLDGAAAVLVERVAAARRPVLAVDLPSGLSGESGAALGPAVRATETVTFFRLKPGHLLMPGRERCGPVTLADIGIDPAVLDGIGATLFHDLPDLWERHYPRPAAAGHKYTRGHLVVVSGPMPTLGAARLSARGGLRIGAGLVTVASPADALAIHAAQLTAVMLKPFDGPEALAGILADARLNAVVMGPGLGHGADAPALVAAALKPRGAPRAAVLDADALTLFAGRADDLAALVRGAGGPVVVTPHDGEFARLFDGAAGVLDAPTKVERARAGARRLGAVVVLKGPDTVVAAPDGRAAIAGEDAPWLATAGSGDVLAGMVGGLLAQAMPAFEAACAAVWLHAAVANHHGPGLISEDLPEALPAVLRALLARYGGR
ncbi:NAD(P)H-hydrate dehydratase [Lichenibacterium dinghuense]|uniref:NAD(P)H-hydrate dehydratase n=1 Tax=Lichenibacterium dinghuense TaxID=2895977 RepID=UPI002816178A|nr:NAD(P)H-hydrate dehydratase [Lichenibacterium sp. 6Y81]